MVRKLSFLAFISLNLISSELSELLKEAEDTATDLKLNIDDMPSSIKVLREDDFRLVGARTLFEALSILPGIELSMLSQGWKYPIIRGQKSAFFSGFDKIKLFIDDIAVNDTTRGNSHFYLDFPIELIDRIEIFKGPNSALYGDGAYSGAINVVTKIKNKSKKNIFISYSDLQKGKFGFTEGVENGDFSIKMDASFQSESNSNPAQSLNLSSQSGNFAINNGSSNEDLRDYLVGLYAKYRDTSLYLRYKHQKSGNYFGLNEILEDDQRYQYKDSFVGEISHIHNLDFAKLNLKVGFNIYKNDSEFEMASSEFGTYYTDKVVTTPMLYENLYQDNRFYAEAILKFNRIHENDISISIKKESVKSAKNSFTYNMNFTDKFFTENYIKGEPKRDNISFYFQDTYFVNDKLDLSLFYRFDDYKQEENQHSLQLGSIYRINDKFKIKSVFNRAYRLPSWIEQSYSELKAERLVGFESSLIYENLLKTQMFEINLFTYSMPNSIDILYQQPSKEPFLNRIFVTRSSSNLAFVLDKNSSSKGSENADKIGLAPAVSSQPIGIASVEEVVSTSADSSQVDEPISKKEFFYANRNKIDTKGFELEYTLRANSNNLFNVSYSFANSDSSDNGNSDRQSLIKFAHSYLLNNKVSFNSFLYYRGSIGEDSYTNEIDSYLSFDEHIIYRPNSNNEFSLTIKNLFDASIKYKSTTGVQPDGLKRDGREVIFSYRYNF